MNHIILRLRRRLRTTLYNIKSRFFSAYFTTDHPTKSIGDQYQEQIEGLRQSLQSELKGYSKIEFYNEGEAFFKAYTTLGECVLLDQDGDWLTGAYDSIESVSTNGDIQFLCNSRERKKRLLNAEGGVLGYRYDSVYADLSEMPDSVPKSEVSSEDAAFYAMVDVGTVAVYAIDNDGHEIKRHFIKDPDDQIISR